IKLLSLGTTKVYSKCVNLAVKLTALSLAGKVDITTPVWGSARGAICITRHRCRTTPYRCQWPKASSVPSIALEIPHFLKALITTADEIVHHASFAHPVKSCSEARFIL
ncbi:hypothetical protein IscW_ISCW000469, partial [Ixodes scapularis]